jgi:hypothetical protein
MEQLVNERILLTALVFLLFFVSMVLYFKLLIINFQNYSLPLKYLLYNFIDCYKIDFQNIAVGLKYWTYIFYVLFIK